MNVRLVPGLGRMLSYELYVCETAISTDQIIALYNKKSQVTLNMVYHEMSR